MKAECGKDFRTQARGAQEDVLTQGTLDTVQFKLETTLEDEISPVFHRH